MKNLLNKIQGLLRREGKGSGAGQGIEDIVKDLNSRIPRMAGSLSELRNRKNSILSELERIRGRSESILKKFQMIEKTGQRELLDNILAEKKILAPRLRELEDQASVMTSSYNEALGEFQKYIDETENLLQKTFLQSRTAREKEALQRCRELLGTIKRETGEERRGEETTKTDTPRGKIDNLRVLSDSAPPHIAPLIITAADLSEEILDTIEDDTRHTPGARKFLFYYAEAVENIVSGYLDISPAYSDSDTWLATTERVQNTLQSVNEAYRKILRKLHEKEMLNLEAELKMMDSLLQEDIHEVH